MASAPQKIGRFQVVGEVGRGGMGVVYKVRSPDDGQMLALKMVPPEQVTRADTALRFKREFRAMQRVEHPNVIRVFEAGTHDGSPFFTMELVDGKDIRRWLDGDEPIVALIKDAPPTGVLLPQQRARLNDPARIRRVVDAVIQVAYALGEIHSHKIVHRDLKPDNILVSKAGVVKLMDFGIAKQMSGHGEHSSGGMVVGTFKYLSPEQALGADVDGRADLYCLGVILYELLAGRHPFYSENSVGYAYHHARKVPPEVNKFNPEVHAGLAQVCERLLKKDPRERYALAADVIAALRAATAREETSGALKASPRKAPGPAQLFAPVLAGRQLELDALLRATQQISRGRGAVQLLRGARGMGKTRLVRELTTHARARHLAFSFGECHSQSALPYQPFVELMQQLAQELDGLPEQTVARILGDDGRVLIRYADAFERLPESVRPRPAPPVEPEAERMRFVSAVSNFLSRCAGYKNRVFVIEDIQHADEMSVRLLRHLVDLVARSDNNDSFVSAMRPAPFGLVLTVDDGVDLPSDVAKLVARVVRDDAMQHHDLLPIDVDAVRELVASMLGDGDVALAVAEFLHSECGGNPAHVEARVRMWAESGELHKREGKWLLVKPPSTASGKVPRAGVEVRAATRADIPIETAAEVVRRRLQRLSPLARDVATRMAVAGERVFVTLLARVALRSEDEFVDALDELLKAGILEEEKDSGTVRFVDAEDQTALLDALAADRRVQLHVLMARAIDDDAHTQRRARNPEELAYHHLRGGEPVQAIERLIEAGRLSLSASATQSAAQRVREAQEHLQRELSTQSGNSELMACDAELVLLRLDVLAAVNEHQECLALAERRLPRLRQTASQRLVLAVLLRLAASARVLGDLDAAQRFVGEVLLATERGEAHALRCRAKSLCGHIYELRGDNETAERYYKDALDLARAIGDDVEEERARASLASRQLVSGQLAAAQAEYEALFQLADVRGEKLRLIHYASALGVIAHERGQFDEAERSYRRVIELAKPAGDRRNVATAQLNIAVVRRDQRRFEEALVFTGRAGRILTELNQAEGIAYVRLVEAQVYLDRHGDGDALSAEKCARASLELAGKVGASLLAAEAHVALGLALARVDRLPEARSEVREGLFFAERVRASRCTLLGLLASAEIALRDGDTTHANKQLAQAAALARNNGAARFLPRIENLQQAVDKRVASTARAAAD